MRASHVAAATFDDPNLVSCGGLVPVAALAERCGLGQLLERHLTVGGTAGSTHGLGQPRLGQRSEAEAD